MVTNDLKWSLNFLVFWYLTKNKSQITCVILILLLILLHKLYYNESLIFIININLYKCINKEN